MSLDDRIAIVTGGTKGVGRGIGRELARQGARVFVTGRSAPDHESLDERITGIRCDHRLDSEVERAFNLIVREANAIDRSAAEGPRLLLAKKVRDAITRDAKKAAGYVLNRHQQAIGFYLRRRPPARCPGRVGCIGTRRRLKARSRDGCSAMISEIRRSCSVIEVMLDGTTHLFPVDELRPQIL
jgi:hypothetical protein